MEAFIIYDPIYGSTEKIARAITGILEAGTIEVGDIKIEDLVGLKLLVVGSPTRMFGPTGAISGFLRQIPAGCLKDTLVAAFDTRIDLSRIPLIGFITDRLGFAAASISRQLLQKGGTLVMPPASFFLTNTKGPLKAGELHRAQNWAEELIERVEATFKFKDFDLLTDGEITLKIEKKVAAIPERHYVPSYFYGIYLYGSNKRIGCIDLRIGDNMNIFYGGHIGYEIYPNYRGHYYAAKACRLIKKVALPHGRERLIITCNPENIASRKTCLKLGAKLIETVNLPRDHELYRLGERRKCRYEWLIEEAPGE